MNIKIKKERRRDQDRLVKLNKKFIQKKTKNRTKNKKEAGMPFEFYKNESTYISKSEISEAAKEKIENRMRSRILGNRALSMANWMR